MAFRYRINRPNARQYRRFPIKEVRIRDIGDCIEALAETSVPAKISGKAVKIRAGKMEQWFPIPRLWLKQRYHLSSLLQIIQRLEWDIEHEPEFAVPLPDAEAEILQGGIADKSFDKKVKRMAKDTVKLEMILEEEVDTGFDYKATRGSVTLSLLSAETPGGDRIFEKIKSAKVEKDKDSLTVVAKLNKKALRAKGDGIPLEEAILEMIGNIQDQTISKAREAAVRQKADDAKGVIAVSYFTNIEFEGE